MSRQNRRSGIRYSRQEERRDPENGFDDQKTIVAQILYAGSLANAEYRADWKDAMLRCFAVTDWTYDSFKQAVETEFGVSIDYNLPLQEYFCSIENEVVG